MNETERSWRFETLALPHLDSAYNLARWLLKNDPEAEDAVQQAFLRAFRYFDGFAGDDARAWILTIVRRSCYDLMRTRKTRQAVLDPLDEVDERDFERREDGPPDPETALLRRRDGELINTLIAALPEEFREILVLREIEDLSYRQIATVVGVPLGTVMSRLARARALLRRAYLREQPKEAVDGL